jgi:hypothetical protein
MGKAQLKSGLRDIFFTENVLSSTFSVLGNNLTSLTVSFVKYLAEINVLTLSLIHCGNFRPFLKAFLTKIAFRHISPE